MMIRRMGKWGWAEESLASIDRADFHRLAAIAAISRSYCSSTPREVSWRHARSGIQVRNYVGSDEAYENRNTNWDKAAREYADELRRQAREKHDYVPLATGYCEMCGEREYARISETSHNTTVWRRVHTNPMLAGINNSQFEDNERAVVAVSEDGKVTCPYSGEAVPSNETRTRITCGGCDRKVAVNLDGTIRKHFMW